MDMTNIPGYTVFGGEEGTLECVLVIDGDPFCGQNLQAVYEQALSEFAKALQAVDMAGSMGSFPPDPEYRAPGVETSRFQKRICSGELAPLWALERRGGTRPKTRASSLYEKSGSRVK